MARKEGFEFFYYGALENLHSQTVSDELPVPHSSHLGIAKCINGIYKNEYVNVAYCHMYDMFVLGNDPENYPYCATPCQFYGSEAVNSLLEDIEADNRVINKINFVLKQGGSSE